MSTCYGDTVFDFDLNFLRPTPNNTAVNTKTDKHRKSILYIKKKTIATDSLIKKYFVKKDALEQTEKNLLNTKEECKQICIDYRKSVETCAKLEKELELVRETKKELESKNFNLESQFGAVNSHAHQLQTLVKEHETVIEALKIENKLGKSNVQDNDKKSLQTLQKEKTMLIKHICLARDIIFGKTKIRNHHKQLLKKYDKYRSQDEKDSLFGEEESNEEGSFNEIPSSPFSEEYVDEVDLVKVTKLQNMNVNIQQSNNTEQNKNPTNSIAECNDVASIDTGRGSSLAFSGSDKCFHSPDYYINDSPLSEDSELNKAKIKLVDSATSPVPAYITVNVSTSPIVFENNVLSNNSNADISVIKNNYSMIDQALSPILLTADTDNTVDTTYDISNNGSPSLKRRCSKGETASKDDNKSIEGEKKRKEKECLELNNSDNICNENSHDTEIEMILNTMRFHNKLITPIPATPAKTCSTSISNVYLTSCKQQESSLGLICAEAVLAREENKKLQAHISELAKEINSIKNMLYDGPMAMHKNIKNPILNYKLSTVNSSNQNKVMNAIKSPSVLKVTSYTTKHSPIANTKCSLDIITEELSNNERQEDSADDNVIEVEENYNTNLNRKSSLDINMEEFSDSKRQEVSAEIVKEVKASDRTNLNRKSSLDINIEEFSDSKRHEVSAETIKEVKASDTANLNRKSALDINMEEFSDHKRQKVSAETVKEVKASDRANLNRKSLLDLNIDDHSNNERQEDAADTVREFIENNRNTPTLQCDDLTTNTNLTEMNLSLSNVSEENVKSSEVSAGNLTKDIQSLSKDDHGKLVNSKKLTKLGKLKRKLLPKFKIRREHLPLKRRSVKFKQIIIPKKKTVTEADSSATLNSQNVYEKAVRVMTELKRKKSISLSENEFLQTNKVFEKTPHISKIECIKEIKQKESDCNIISHTSTSIQIPSVKTRSCSNVIALTPTNYNLTLDSSEKYELNKMDFEENREKYNDLSKSPESKRRRKRLSENIISEIPCKRVLRSSTLDNSPVKSPKIILHRCEETAMINSDCNSALESPKSTSGSICILQKAKTSTQNQGEETLFYPEVSTKAPEHKEDNDSKNIAGHPRDSILCRMIEQYGVKSVKFGVKKVSDSITNSVAKKIEDGIARIIELSANDTQNAMDKFVTDIQNWDFKHFLAGLMKYLKDPARKIELFNKIVAPSAPALTKPEQVLLYVISELKMRWSTVDTVDKILCCMEFTLFALNRTPQFEVIESMSHFYAVICRYFKMKTRLRLFVLDAMYCIQFKAVPLIRQCMEVWMHILPLAHMASARTPLVTCLVYLLHFYKCVDKLNRVQDIRNILSRKYFYKITEWNETKILELFKNSIKALKGFPAETKMLRIALIILAKRHGPRWCQNNIVKNLLQPIIENPNTSEEVKAFCVSMLGPLLKPYPADMKVHCEIVMNQLITMLQQTSSTKIAEGIVTSLIFINKHNQFRVIQALVSWTPQKVSAELEVILRDFVKTKPLKIWKSTLTKAIQ